MTGFIIVTESMEHAIKRDLDALRDTLPETERTIFESEYSVHRQAILDHFAEYGTYPQIGGVEKSNANR
jgi:hypothetical protein